MSNQLAGEADAGRCVPPAAGCRRAASRGQVKLVGFTCPTLHVAKAVFLRHEPVSESPGGLLDAGGCPRPELLTVTSLYVYNIASSEVSLSPSCWEKYLKLGSGWRGVGCWTGAKPRSWEAVLQVAHMADPAAPAKAKCTPRLGAAYSPRPGGKEGALVLCLEGGCS